MRDVNEHATHAGATQDHGSVRPSDPDRRRNDPSSPAGGAEVGSTPQECGGDEPLQAAGVMSRERGDPASPGGGGINPGPPQRGGNYPPAGGTKAPGNGNS